MTDDYSVVVLRVIDGDSVKVRLPNGDEYSVRMYGIDAPEKAQRAGSESQDYLQQVVRSRREWRLRVVDTDRYQRLVGVLYPEGGSVRDSANHAMVESGFAYWYREYGGEELGFDDSERYARRARAGVWESDGSVKPWEFRRAKRAEQRSRRESPESRWLVLIGGAMLIALLKASASSGGRRRRRRRRW